MIKYSNEVYLVVNPKKATVHPDVPIAVSFAFNGKRDKIH